MFLSKMDRLKYKNNWFKEMKYSYICEFILSYFCFKNNPFFLLKYP